MSSSETKDVIMHALSSVVVHIMCVVVTSSLGVTLCVYMSSSSENALLFGCKHKILHEV